MQQALPSKRVVIVATLVAFILVALGLNMPKGSSMVVAQYATATSPSAAPSADEVRERALGIFRTGASGGSNGIGAVTFLWKSTATLAGSIDIWIPINGTYVQVSFFGSNLVADSATSAVTLPGVGPAAGWTTTMSPSSLGANYRTIEIKNPAGVTVAKYDVKIN
jgi:hypothetical protein